MSNRIREIIDYDPLTGLFTRKKYSRGCPPNKRGWKNAKGYIEFRIDGTRYYGHRLAWWFVHGEWPKDEIDHINGNPSDNRIVNLRLAVRRQNAANGPARRAGLKGAYLHKPTGRWRAEITVDWVCHYLGYFDTEAEAHAAYCRAALKHNGEFARFT